MRKIGLMGASISYMGTKKEFAHSVASVITHARPGMLLDAFAGMGAVAGAVSPARQVWTNDVQRFAHVVGQCMFTSDISKAEIDALEQALGPLFDAHLTSLLKECGGAIRLSDAAYQSSTFDDFASRIELAKAAEIPTVDHSCFLRTYRDGYFTARQTAEIDALRYAMDTARSGNRITEGQHSWALMALGRACLKIANTPGHFAQFLKPSPQNYKRVKNQAGKKVWSEWLRSLGLLEAVGSTEWRSGNRSTRSDSLELLAGEGSLKGVGVVYCDPPYTDDQYSRFYHVWETLVEYDYPETTGAGLYRPGRFVAPFSIKSKVSSAMHQLIGSVSSGGADLVMSYPSNGLLYDCGVDIFEMLKEYFSTVVRSVELSHHHSTFGASKGSAKSQVTEQIFLASNI